MWRSLFRAGAIVSAGVFLGRIAGFLRELFLANRLGAGPDADLAVYGLTLPDVFTNLLVGGALGAVLVPEFKAAPGRARALCIQTSGLVLLGFGALAAAAAWSGPLLVRLLAPGFSPRMTEEAARLAAGTLAAVPLTAAAAVTTAYLQSRDRFTVPVLGTLIFNGGVIAALALWVAPGRLMPLAWGVVAAAALRWGSQAVQAAALRPPAPGVGGWAVPRSLPRRYAEALGSMGLLILSPFAARALASGLGEGAVASVNYAQKIVELPMGVAVGVLAVVLLPRFSELHAAGALEETRTLARQGLWLSWILALPATLGLAWYSDPLARALFGHGKMTPEAAARIGELAAWSLPALPAQGLVTLLYALLSARRDTARPFRWNLLLFALYLAGAWAGRDILGLRGIMLAGVLLQWALAAVYLGLLRRHHGLGLLSRDLLSDFARATVAAALAFAPAALLVSRGAAPALGLAAAAGGGACALAAILLLPSRTLPGGWTSILRRQS